MCFRRLPLLILLLVASNYVCMTWAQQSAAGQDTLIGIVGRDFVMMGADSSSSGGGGIALTSSNIDKIAVIHDGKSVLNGHAVVLDRSRESLEQQAIAIGFAGDAADADRLMGTLKTHVQVMEFEAGIGNDVLCVFDCRLDSSRSTSASGALSPAGLDAEALASLSRNEIASRMRSSQPLQLCLLVGGMVRCTNPVRQALPEIEATDRVRKQILAGSAAFISKSNIMPADGNESIDVIVKRSQPPKTEKLSLDQESHMSTNPFLTPKLFWLDQYGSLQNMQYAAHGFGSNFAYSVLDQTYRNNMSREEALGLIRECFEQLRQRYVINSPMPPRIKCIDRLGVTEIIDNTNKY